MIGLTATPANFIDRDTFRFSMRCQSAPTFLYTFKQAVNEGFLVDFSLYQAHTGFQRKGIKGVDLSEEDRNALIEQGIDPDASTTRARRSKSRSATKTPCASNGRRSWRSA